MYLIKMPQAIESYSGFKIGEIVLRQSFMYHIEINFIKAEKEKKNEKNIKLFEN